MECCKKRKNKKYLWIFAGLLSGVLILVGWSVCCHNRYFTPEYEEKELSIFFQKRFLTSRDYDELLLQTGLGRSAVNKLRGNENGLKLLKEYQEQMFSTPVITCNSIFGGFVREDLRLTESGEWQYGPEFVDLRPGDIIVSLSTHSFGWSHGHAGLVIDQEHALESTVIGSKSKIYTIEGWRKYGNYVILRVKNTDDAMGKKVAEYAAKRLVGIPYRLTTGFFGKKEMLKEEISTVQCAYLVWYAWYRHGIDLNSNGGMVITPWDLISSKEVEIVQICGMDPRKAGRKVQGD